MKKIFAAAGVLVLCLSAHAQAYKLENSYDIYRAEDITIDGSLDDWDKYRYTYLILPTKEEQVSYFSAYAGPEDLSAVFWFAWSDDGLYMAARVNDNINSIVEGTSCWSGDSIQFAVGIDNAYGPELAFSTENKVYRYSAGKAALGEDRIVFKAVSNDSVTIYEVFFPWGTLGSGRPEEYIPFCICMNENDGTGRVGWIESSAGIASTKSAAEFSVLKLINKEPEPNTGGPIRPEIKDITIAEEQNSEAGKTVIYEIKTNITYPDVKLHWARTAIDNMASRGIVRGIGELYYPDAGMNRAEFAAVLVRAVGLDPAEYKGGLSDVAPEDWCCEYIQAACDGELLPESFISGGYFRPDNLITREEMFALFCNAFLKSKNLPLTGEEPAFADSNEISAWTLPYIRCAQQLEMISGNEENRICPQKEATRAEIAVMAYRYIKMSE